MKKGDSEARRFSRLNRTVLLIKELLSGKELDRRSTAALLDIRLAAADRQLAAIKKIPGVVTERKGRSLMFRFERAALQEPPTLSTTIASCFGASLGPLFAGTPYETAFREARDLLIRQSRRSGSFRHLERKFVFLSQGGEMSLPDESGQLDDLIEAVLRQKQVTINYQDFGNEVRHRRIKPLSLVVYNHQLYLLGMKEGGALRSFRFSRIKNTAILEDTFEYPSRPEYDPDQVFAGSFGVFMSDGVPAQHVELRLAPRWATYARTHRWHRSQRVSVTKDEVRITLNVHICPEVEGWVLSFGEEAEVIEPPALREKIAGRVRALARVYGDAQPRSSTDDGRTSNQRRPIARG